MVYNKYRLAAVGVIAITGVVALMVSVADATPAEDAKDPAISQGSPSSPSEGDAGAPHEEDFLELANSIVDDLRQGATSAAMTVTTYEEFMRVIAADTHPTTTRLGPTDPVIVVGVNGDVDTSSIRWPAPHPERSPQPIPEAGGTLVAVDEQGRLIARYVFFNPESLTPGEDNRAIALLHSLSSDVVELVV